MEFLRRFSDGRVRIRYHESDTERMTEELLDEVRNSLRDIMLDEAILALEDVKKTHFAIEKIYIDAMDFEAKEKFTADFIRRLEL